MNATAKPLIVEPVYPIAQQPAPQPTYEQPRAAEPAYQTPRMDTQRFEPTPSYEPEPELTFDAPAIPTPPPVITPPAQHTMHVEPPRVMIVDPLVAEEGELDAPLYADPHFEDSRQQRKGFLSLFGGRPQQQQRYEGPPAVRATGRAQTAAAPQMMEEPQAEEGEDLEIPSFLRRLAN